MDSGRLPAYRSSYLLRFHPYPRTKPSVREIIAASMAQEPARHESLQTDNWHMECDTPFALNQAIHKTGVHDEIWLRQQRLSTSPLVDLALLCTKLNPPKEH